jgi:hypothetical protein
VIRGGCTNTQTRPLDHMLQRYVWYPCSITSLPLADGKKPVSQTLSSANSNIMFLWNKRRQKKIRLWIWCQKCKCFVCDGNSFKPRSVASYECKFWGRKERRQIIWQLLYFNKKRIATINCLGLKISASLRNFTKALLCWKLPRNLASPMIEPMMTKGNGEEWSKYNYEYGFVLRDMVFCFSLEADLVFLSTRGQFYQHSSERFFASKFALTLRVNCIQVMVENF